MSAGTNSSQRYSRLSSIWTYSWGDGRAVTRLDYSLIPPLCSLESFPTDFNKDSPQTGSLFKYHHIFQGNLTPMYITMLSMKILAHSVSPFFYLKHWVYCTHLWYLVCYNLTFLISTINFSNTYIVDTKWSLTKELLNWLKIPEFLKALFCIFWWSTAE